jgi:DNA-directed RNA polymerase subunit M/transcription elongation factor TFIIS
MSEFKFVCPICGQHMMCDASQAGTVLECPTCFQKITAPQAPSKDSKFILTGTKVSEKKISVRGLDAPNAAAEEKSLPAKLFVLVAVGVCAFAAAAFFLLQRFDKSPDAAGSPAAKNQTPAANNTPAPLVAPVASDRNWSLTLDKAVIPGGTVVGRIHGKDFIIERASFGNGTLILRAGFKGPVEFGVLINFNGAPPEALAGKKLNITVNADQAANVQLRWPDETGAVQKVNFDSGYAMRLELGNIAKGKLPGKIYLCTPDAEKSYLLGSFTATLAKAKPAKL